jgi:hypothetical protein
VRACGVGEFESGQLGGSDALQRCAGPPGGEADEIDRGGGEGVFQADFARAGVAGVAGPGDRGDLVDGAFDQTFSPIPIRICSSCARSAAALAP